jgi:hypothetical protein
MLEELFHADGRTKGQMTKLIGAFLSYANAPNKSKVVPYLSGTQWATKQILFRYLLLLDSTHVPYAFHSLSKRLSNEHFAVPHTACKNTLV